MKIGTMRNYKFNACSCVFSVWFQKVLLRRLVFALMQKEEFIPNAEDWVYKVAKNREALQEGGTLRYCSTVMQLALISFYIRCLKTASA